MIVLRSSIYFLEDTINFFLNIYLVFQPLISAKITFLAFSLFLISGQTIFQTIDPLQNF